MFVVSFGSRTALRHLEWVEIRIDANSIGRQAPNSAASVKAQLPA
jgi:hypothetical protein